MIHVHVPNLLIFVFLVLLLPDLIFTCSEELGAKKSIDINDKSISSKKTVKISETNETALLESPRDVLYYNFLSESPVFNDMLNEDEQKIVNQLCRLGVQVLFSQSEENNNILLLKYKSTNVYEAKTKNNQFLPDESYLPQKFTDQSSIYPESDDQQLKQFILRGKLMNAILLISKRPETILELGTEFLAFVLFSVEAVNSGMPTGYIIKNFIILHSPESFISAFILAYRSSYSVAWRLELLGLLLESITDVFCPNGNVQKAFISALNTPNCPISILSTFVSSHRPLKASEPEILKRFIMTGNDENCKERVSLLLGINVDKEHFVESVIAESILSVISNSSTLQLLTEIFMKKQLVNKLDTKFLLNLVQNVINSGNVQLAKTIFTTPILQCIKSLPNYRNLIIVALISAENCLEISKFMVNLHYEKSNLPFLLRTDLIGLAFRALNRNKIDLVKYLIENRFISSRDTLKTKHGRLLTIMGLAVQENLVEFVKWIDSVTVIDWRACADCFKLIRSDEMKETLDLMVSKKIGLNDGCTDRKKSLKRAHIEVDNSNSEKSPEMFEIEDQFIIRKQCNEIKKEKD